MSVPGGWTDLLRDATHHVDVLAFAGLFLTEDHGAWLPLVRDRAAAGARIRPTAARHRRSDTGQWAMPTGGLMKGEMISQCAVRECGEEPGWSWR